MIVDDHQLFRDGLRLLLENMPGFEVVGEAGDGHAFLEFINTHEVDVVLMDIGMPRMDGIEATQQALKKKPDLPIIALSMFNDTKYYKKALEAGVKGFIKKDSGQEELRDVLLTVLSGETFFSQELLRKIIIDNKETPNNQDKNIQLSRREREVLTLLCQGYSTNQIADRLSISHRTVEGHRSHLLQKTNTQNAIALVLYAIRNKLVQITV